MKKIILLTIILVSAVTYAQSNTNTKFAYGEEGLVPRNFIVDVEGMDKDELLSQAEKWLNEKYEAPKRSKNEDNDDDDKSGKAIKTGNTVVSYKVYEDDENDGSATGKAKKAIKLRFTGFTHNAICFGTELNYSCEDLEYIIELRFRDGDYRFKPIKLTYKAATDKKKQTISLKKHKFHSKEGKVKEGYEKVSSQIEALLNNLNKSIFNYLTGKAQEDEW